jgi:hypothetical protein
MLAWGDVMKRTGTLIAVLLALLAAAPAAQANAFKDIFGAYRTTGTVNACKWSAKQLTDAKRQVPNDIDQYAPDFPAALDDAIQKRASGACSKSAAAAPATSTPAASPPSQPTATTGVPPGTTPAAPTANGQAPQPAPASQPAPAVADNAILAASKTRHSDAGIPAPLVALAIIGALIALAALLYGLARWWAWEPNWLVRWRHAGAEAGWRASGSWAEFMDWVRLGR